MCVPLPVTVVCVCVCVVVVLVCLVFGQVALDDLRRVLSPLVHLCVCPTSSFPDLSGASAMCWARDSDAVSMPFRETAPVIAPLTNQPARREQLSRMVAVMRQHFSSSAYEHLICFSGFPLCPISSVVGFPGRY